NLGTVYQAKGDFEKAVVANETALRVQPDYVSARLNYALALKSAGYIEDAVEQYKKVLDQNPNEPAAHLSLGGLYAREPATLALARKHYQRFVELAPNSPAAREVQRWLAGGG